MADASEGATGPPKVLGPQGGASKPASFGPPGGSGASANRPASTPQPEGTASSSGSGASASNKPAAKEPPKAEAPPAAPEEDIAGDLPIPVGTVARITGLKSETAAKLNGSLCAVLRAAETSDRVIVKTRMGEKSLKPANLEVGKCVYPRGSGYVPAVLLLIASGTIADSMLNRGLNGFSTATIPILATICMGFTLCVSFYLHRPCKKDETWVPAVSMMSSSMPARHVYRFGFMGAAVLVAVMVWLTSELLMTQLVEPIQPPPDLFMNVSPAVHSQSAPPEAAEDGADSDAEPAAEVAATSEESADSSHEEAMQDSDAGSEHELASGSSDPSAATSGEASNTTNATARKLAQWRNETAMLEWAPASVIKWGYISAAGLGAQGLFAYEDRLSVQSVLHVGGFAAFIAGALQHAVLSHSVLGSSAARTMTEAWPPVKYALRARRYIAEGGPIVMMLVVLVSQSTSSFGRQSTRPSRTQTLTTRGLFKESGLGKSIAMMQWAALACMAVFYSTFALDFWVGSLLAGQTLIEVDM